MADKVRVRSEGGYLRLSWTIGGLGRQRMSLGLTDTLENWKRAAKVAEIIELDIYHNLYDSSKKKYKLLIGKAEVKASDKKKGILDPVELLEKFGRYKLETKQITESSFRSHYKAVYSWIDNNCPNRDSVKIFNSLVKNKPYISGNMYFLRLRSAYDFAISQGFTDINPYSNFVFPKSSRAMKTEDRKSGDPFTAEERDLIIQGFSTNEDYKWYTTLIKLLFACGCRPGEAVALEPKHVQDSRGRVRDRIVFEQSLSLCEKGKKVTAGTKTCARRTFPVNGQFKEILEQALSESKRWDNGFLFPGPRGKIIYPERLNSRGWDRVLRKLPVRYLATSTQKKRTIYTCRDTFASLCLEKGMPIAPLAEWMGTSSEVLKSHYTGFSNSSLSIPNL